MVHFLVILSLFVSAVPDSAQVFQRPLSEAEILCIEAEDERASYDFSAALASYRKSLDYPADSLRRVRVDSLMAICRNGIAMSEFCYRPKVAARQRFGAGEFLDYYPLASNQRERLSASPVDTLMLVDSTRIAAFFPIESEGYVYFSSRDLPGVGGADLYRCRRLGGSAFVGEPENLGFPYSSPYDDFLFINSPDGRYSIFASNRNCSADSVSIYILEYEPVPVSSAVRGVEDLQKLCRLDPPQDLKKVDNKSAMSTSKAADPNTELYARKAAEVRRLREEITRLNRELSTLRAFYNSASPAEKSEMADKIVKKEARLPGLQSQLVAANKDLQTTEMDFLLHGVLIDRSRVEAESDNEVVGVETSYTFTRRSPGSSDF